MTTSEPLTLGAIINIKKGKKHSTTETTSQKTKRLIGIDDLRNDNLIRLTDNQSGTQVYPDDIMIAWDGANAGTIGFGKSGFIGSTIARLRFKETDKFYTPFVAAFLQSKFNYLRQTATGATIPHINRKALEGIVLPDFRLDEQKRIAYLFKKVKGAIAQRKQHLQQLDNLLKIVFLEMFGFLNSSFENQNIDKLSSHADVTSGVTKGKKYKEENLKEVPYMRVANVQDGYFDMDEIKTISVTIKEIEKYRLKKGDLLLTEGGDPDKLGRGSVWEGQIDDCIHQNHIFRVRTNDPSELNPYYLSALVSSRYGKAYFLKSAKQTTGIASINSTQLKNFPVVIPSERLQIKFAGIAAKVKNIKAYYGENLNDLENLYGALSQKAFKGDLDLSRVPLPLERVESTKDEAIKTTGQTQTTKTFILPTPATPTALHSAEGRRDLLRQWMTVWLGQRSDTLFSTQAFIDAAQQRLLQLDEEGEEILEWSVAEYDSIRNCVFKALESDHLAQTYDNANNRVQLHTVSSQQR